MTIHASGKRVSIRVSIIANFMNNAIKSQKISLRQVTKTALL